MPRKLCWMSLPGLSLTFTPGGYGQTHVESAFPLFLVVIPVSLGYLRLQVLLLPAASLELKPLSSGQNLSVEARGGASTIPNAQSARVPHSHARFCTFEVNCAAPERICWGPEIIFWAAKAAKVRIEFVCPQV